MAYLAFFIAGFFANAWPLGSIVAAALWLYGFFFGERLPWLRDYADRPGQALAIIGAGALYFILCCSGLMLAANVLHHAIWGTWP